MQFYPIDGVYVYFRYDSKQKIMCIMNTNEKPATIGLERYHEQIKGFRSAKDVVTGDIVAITDSLRVSSMSNWVLELQ